MVALFLNCFLKGDQLKIKLAKLKFSKVRDGWTLVPHIFVWGSCFWFCIPSAACSSRSRRLLPSHTTCAHTQLVHTPLAHTQLAHTQLVHTPLLITPLVTPLLVHTQLVFNLLVHTQLVITPLVLARLVLGVAPVTPRLLAWQA